MARKRLNFDEATETEKQVLLYERACDYLSRREHSEKELRQKLKRKFKSVTAKELDALLGKLKDLGFQSDERFTESYVRNSVFRKYGPGKIKFELGRKGIQKDKSEKAMDEEEINFIELAQAFAERKFRRLIEKYPDLDYSEKQKVKEKMYRALCSRGFAYGDVKEVIENTLP